MAPPKATKRTPPDIQNCVNEEEDRVRKALSVWLRICS